MEKIEQMEANTSKWESKMKELAYKKQLIGECEKLKKGTNRKKMLKYYPEMAEFMTDNEDDAENNNYSENSDNNAESEEYVDSDSKDDNDGK